MSVDDLLSQDEVDALLGGLDDGDIDTDSGGFDEVNEGGVSAFDFTNQERIIRGNLPALEMINERFARNFRISLFDMLHRASEISVGGIEMMKFSEYTRNLFVPTSLNLVTLAPLRGIGLIVMEPTLIFAVIENYFGGGGKYPFRIEGREFTVTEQRIIQMILKNVFKDLEEAWRPVENLEFKFKSAEVNPQFANIVNPNEVVVVTNFTVEMEGGAGSLHTVFPYSMLEPIRDVLESGMQTEQADGDDRWVQAMRDEVEMIDVNVSSTMVELQMLLGDVVKLEPGDVIPVEMPETATVKVESVPMFRGEVGVHDGHVAIRLLESVELVSSDNEKLML